jgi:hypothetical protein
MEIILEILLNPGWVIGLCMGALAALGLHWLLPEASPVFGALLVVAGGIGGALFSGVFDHTRPPPRR